MGWRGFRDIEHGPFVEAGLPKLQDLLLSEYISLDIFDRQREALGLPASIAHFKNCRATGFNTTISARQLEEVTVHFVSLGMDDESAINSEGAFATDLPTIT